MKRILSFFGDGFRQKMALDMGSFSTRMVVPGKGLVFDEHTAITRQRQKRWVGLSAPVVAAAPVVAYGDRAYAMRHCEPRHLEVVMPVVRGVLSDLSAARSYVSFLIRRFHTFYGGGGVQFFKPEVLLVVPSIATSVETRTLVSLFKSEGVEKVDMVLSTVASSVELGLDPEQNEAMFVVEVGGGKTEGQIIYAGGVVVGGGIKVGGQDLDTAIINYFKFRHGMLVGLPSAERIKIQSGGVSGKSEGKIVVRGRDLSSGLPKSVSVASGELFEPLSAEVAKISRYIGQILDQTPSDLVDGVIQRGIFLTGAGAKLASMSEYLEREVRVPVHVVEEPEFCAVRGAGKLLTNTNLFGKVSRVVY